jgi:N-acetylglucosamine-6-phosphate deacetylase
VTSTPSPAPAGATEYRERVVLAGAAATCWPEPDVVVDVAIEHGRIVAIGPDLDRRPSDRRVNLHGLRLAPGYIDLQVNGGHGFDVTTDPASMWDVAAELPRHGVTAFLPTIITSSAKTVDRAIEAVQRAPTNSGARIVGLHLEGPFIHPERRGTHPTEHLVLPGAADIDRWTSAAGIRMVTLAPELGGAVDVIRRLTEQGVVVAAGHSAATYEEAGAAIDAGLRAVTHLFNGMARLEHRAPGLAGRALTDERLMASLIVDGHHLHPATVVIAFRLLGVDRTILVSDSTAAAGQPPGRYVLGDVAITLADDETLRNDEGVLAGSILTMDRAVRNLRDLTGCSPAAAVATATATPARLLGDDTIGTLSVGTRADLVVLDERLDVVATLVGGAAVHDPDGRFATTSGEEER